MDIGSNGNHAQVSANNGGGELLGGFSFDYPQQGHQPPPQNQANISNNKGLLDDDFLGSNSQPQPQQKQPQQPQMGGFDLLGDSSSPVSHPQQTASFNQPPPTKT